MIIKIKWKPNATMEDRLNLYDEMCEEYIFYVTKEDVYNNNTYYWTPILDTWFTTKY